MRSIRQAAPPVAFATLVVYWSAALTPGVARGQSNSEHELVQVSELPAAAYDEDGLATLSEHLGDAPAEPDAEEPGELSDVPRALAALPSGGSEVSPQATALPGGPATTLGMGESFTTQLSTGAVSFSIPFSMPAARGGVQPRLDLSYTSAGGFGVAGVGWSLGGAAISRQTDRGLPSYDDRGDWHPTQDRFVFGGMELVPICLVSGAQCLGALSGEVMPAWANGWLYFRARIEGGFLRLFWSHDHRTWRVQAKDGTTMELGVPLDGSGYDGGLERNPDDEDEIFRWYLVRQYDSNGDAASAAQPAPVNVLVYRYFQDGGAIYLSDIYDTPPAANPTGADLSLYAHHASLAYQARPDPAVSYRTGWRVEHALRLARVDITSKPFAGPASQRRELVRRYHLTYDSSRHTSLLSQVQTEGRCSDPVQERSDERLPLTSCPRLPAMRLEYQHAPGASAPLTDAQGLSFEGFTERVQRMPNSPPHALDEALAELMDVNADGLQDVVVTAPGVYQGRHAAFFNALTPDGQVGFAAPELVDVTPAGGIDASVLMLNNTTVTALDLDGDGVANLIHMPFGKNYSVFRPDRVGTKAWPGDVQWTGRAVATASQQNVKIDFTQRSADTQVLDVNGDGLVDIVHTGPTRVETFFALGRLPGGDDQFGRGALTAFNSALIDNDPTTACVPWSAQPVRLSDLDTFIGDLNGDGLGDLARVRSGEILYWPGRGNGFFGAGARDDCSDGFAVDRHIAMLNAPTFGVSDPGTLLLNDVNADGLSDIVEVRNQGVDIYLNDNGSGWTDRHTIRDTPFRPSDSNYVRLTDIDGSGTPDILWGAANEYQYIDLMGGVSPLILTTVHNGIGKTLEFEYASSTKVMRDAALAGRPWDSFGPANMPVLVRSTKRDNLELIGRQAGVYTTEYDYRDPVYEGRQREFRGFRVAEVRTLGDASSPTAIERSVFQLGECPVDETGNADVCSPAERWQDNWREGLKGLPVLKETFDERGVYLKTEHTSYRLRQLYTGRDGRRVTAPMPVGRDTYLYDTASFDARESSVSLPEVSIDLVGLSRVESRPVTLRATAGTAHIQARTSYDDFGNTIESVQSGCVAGCPAGVDEVITAHSDFELSEEDGSGWFWRETHSYTTGSQHPEPRNQVDNTYDGWGRLVLSRGLLSGSLPLDRFHETGGAVAPAPADASAGASTPVPVLFLRNTYDAFGNIVSWRAANGRCGGGDVDPVFAQMPVVARVFVGLEGASGCGPTELTQQVTFDRGMETVLDTIDARQQPSRFTYDGFGRLISSWTADPDRPGQLAPLPSILASYDMPADDRVRPYSIVYMRTQDGPSPSVASYQEGYSFVDGMDRPLLNLLQADPAAGDGGNWIASGLTFYNAKGARTFACDPLFFTGGPFAYPMQLADRTAVPSGCTFDEYDAFGRAVRTYRRTGTQDAELYHHALSLDVWDAADRQAGSRQGTYLTTITDGHGRSAARTERIHVGATIEQRHVIQRYLPTGQVERTILRRQGSPDVERWLRYDSLGRMVLNVEPNTSLGFNPNPATNPSSIKAFRYAYNDAGNMVGYSDARGCGANYVFDTGGRLISEDRSPCMAHQRPYSAPNLATGDGTEAFYRYDAPDPAAAAIVDAGGNAFTIDSAFLRGRLVSVAGLGSMAAMRYDARGRGTGLALRVQKPGPASATLAQRYTPRWYVQTLTLDAKDRVRSAATGATVPELLGDDGKSNVIFGYSKRGGLTLVDSSYGRLSGGLTLADGALTYDANGLPKSATLGDAARTRRDYIYNADLRTEDVLTYRANLALWTNPPPGSPYVPAAPGEDPTRQLLLEDLHFSYDVVGNLTAIEDNRVPTEWPSSAKPTNRTFQYDDLYRLTRASYSAAGGSDTWRSPFEAERSDSSRPQPMPEVGFSNRVAQQDYAFDWLGNIRQSTDEQHGFWDRSTGDRSHGTSSSGPHQLRSASNRALAPGSTRKGDLDASYDPAGNLIALIIRRDGACLPATASCWQRFDYQYDEVGMLARARRWDLAAAPSSERTSNGSLTSPLPPRAADADLRFGYDSGGNRVLKSATTGAGQERHEVYLFETMELRGAAFDAGSGDYTLSPQTVSLRVLGGPVSARIIYSQQSLPTLTSGQQHVFLELGDHLGSSSFVIDRATGELVEYSTYQPYGVGESDYRPGRWGSFREPYQFTGKEQDIEVGLTYFGARYYSPYLGVWITPDPAAIQDLKSDPNPYAYVHGSPVMAVDPDGRLAFLVVVAIAAVVAAAANLGSQLAANGGSFAQVNWGFKGVLGAFVVGAVAGAVSFGVGSFAVGAFGAAFGAMAAGAVSAGVSYVVGSAFNGFKGFSGDGLLLSMGIGAVGGFIGGALGDVLPQEAWWNQPLASTASAAASYGITAINEKSFDAANFAIGMGAAVGSSVASTLAAKAPGADEGIWLERVENSGDYRLTDTAKDILRPYYEKAGLDLDAMRYRFVNDLPNSTGFCLENRVALDVADWNDVGANPIKQFELIAHETAHAIQYMKIGAYHGGGAINFLSRYFMAGLIDPTQGRQYGVPTALRNVPIEQVNIIDPHYSLDQLADTVARRFAVPAVKKFLGQP
jgi:RHS repeat-associated protein